MIETQLTSCPKCGAAVEGRIDTCNRCGILFAKVRTDTSSFAPPEPRGQVYQGTVYSPTASPSPTHSLGRSCQACGSQGATTQVVFRQNIGAVVMRFSKTLDARLCKGCLWKNFGQYTLITAAVGWCGFLSAFIAPVFVLMNVVNVVSASFELAGAKASPGR